MSEMNHSKPQSTAIADGPAFDFQGVSVRDYFAAKALIGILSGSPDTSYANAAILAYEYADAILAHRSHKGKVAGNG